MSTCIRGREIRVYLIVILKRMDNHTKHGENPDTTNTSGNEARNSSGSHGDKPVRAIGYLGSETLVILASRDRESL